jgi:hypothetical protein
VTGLKRFITDELLPHQYLKSFLLDKIQPKITHSEALEALSKVRLYEEQQEHDLQYIFKPLIYLEKEVKKRQVDERRQMDIQSYFS